RLFGQATTRVTPAPAPGWGHAVATAGQRPMLYKASRSQDTDAYQDAVTCDEWRPAMDEITLGEGEVRSEEHTSELQSRENLVCRLLLEKKTTASMHNMKL